MAFQEGDEYEGALEFFKSTLPQTETQPSDDYEGALQFFKSTLPKPATAREPMGPPKSLMTPQPFDPGGMPTSEDMVRGGEALSALVKSAAGLVPTILASKAADPQFGSVQNIFARSLSPHFGVTPDEGERLAREQIEQSQTPAGEAVNRLTSLTLLSPEEEQHPYAILAGQLAGGAILGRIVPGAVADPGVASRLKRAAMMGLAEMAEEAPENVLELERLAATDPEAAAKEFLRREGWSFLIGGALGAATRGAADAEFTTRTESPEIVSRETSPEAPEVAPERLPVPAAVEPALEAIRSQESTPVAPQDAPRNAPEPARLTFEDQARAQAAGIAPRAPEANVEVPEGTEPPVPARHVRYYRGEGAAGGGGQDATFFSKNPERAATYGDEVSYIDVPVGLAKEYEAAARKAGSGTPGDAVVPVQLAGRAKPAPWVQSERLEIQAEPEAKVEPPKRQKGFDPEFDSLSDFVRQRGLSFSGEIPERFRAGMTGRGGKSIAGFFRKEGAGNLSPDQMAIEARNAGFLIDEDVHPEDFLDLVAQDYAAKQRDPSGKGRIFSAQRQFNEVDAVNVLAGEPEAPQRGDVRLEEGELEPGALDFDPKMFEEEMSKGDETKSLAERAKSEEGVAPIITDIASAALSGGRKGVDAAKFIVRNYGRSLVGVARKLEQKDASGRSIGRQIANRIEANRQWMEPKMGRALAAHDRVKESLTPREYREMVRLLDTGRMRSATVNATKVRNAARMMRAELDKVHQLARAIGWDLGKIKNYYPHRFEKGKGIPPGMQAPPNYFAVMRSRNYNLERTREQGVTGYRKDKAVLDEYLIDSYKQLGEAYFFGRRTPGQVNSPGLPGMGVSPRSKAQFDPQRDQLRGMADLIRQIEDEGVRDTIEEGFRRMTGNEAEGAGDRILRKAADVNAFISLSTSGLSQVQQAAQLISDAGIRPVMKTAIELMRDPKAYREWKRDALRVGATIPNVRKELVSAMGSGRSSAGGELRSGFMWGLNTTDQTLRVISTRTARHMLEGYAKAGNTEALEYWGVKGRQPNAADYDRVAKRLTDKSQFRADTQDLPVGFTDAKGRLLFQFQSFMHRQSDWILGKAKDITTGSAEERKQAVRSLATFMLASAAIGELTQDLKAILLDYDVMGEDEVGKNATNLEKLEQALDRAFSSKTRTSVNSPLLRAVQNFTMVGGLGLLWTLPENFVDAVKRRNPVRLAGPTAERAARLFQQVSEGDVPGAARIVTPNLIRQNIEREEIPFTDIENPLADVFQEDVVQGRRRGGRGGRSER